MKNPQHQYSMSAAATILLGLASFAAAQTSSFKDPLTGEPIPLIKRSDIRMPRRKIQAACSESIDVQRDSYYHPTLDPDKGATCTNSNEYPMIWKQIPKGSDIPQYISSTGQECCEKFYERQGVPRGTCGIEDVCNLAPPSPPPTPAPPIPGKWWHSSKYNPTQCTNSGDYPVSWNDANLRRYHLFDTSAKCCAEVEKKTQQTCDVLDVLEEWSCDKWHLAIEKDEDSGLAVHRDGTCTNSGIIYDVWMATQDVYVFPNHQACCDNFKIAYDDCHKVDECAEPSNPPTPLPTTKSPTPVPTPVPTTKAPTPVPTTKAPTRSPVVFDIEAWTCNAASTSENGLFHIDKYGSLSCSNSLDYPSSWENVLDSDGKHKFLFDTMEECVAHFTPFLNLGETVKMVNVCSPDCCSYMKEHNLPFVEKQCEGGCEVTTTTTSTTTTTVPELNDPECEKAAAYYHPPKTMDAPYCTNSEDYPQSWHNVLDSDGNHKFLFTSIDDCCYYFFESGVKREDCVEVDVCSSDCCSYTKEHNLPSDQCQGGCDVTTTTATTTTTTTTTAPGSCPDRSFSLYWHPSTSDDILCTNSPGYPSSWRAITATPKFLYDSAEDCCNNYYGSFGIPMISCKTEDLCPDGKLVSVAADDPITTSTTTSTTITTTTSSPPSSSPTRNPTNLPTHSPSDSPTRFPTNLPTHSPSDSPTKRPSDKPVADVACAEVWKPVCGEDGVSYSNDCEAIKADVKVVSVGECEPPAENCSPGRKCSEGSSCAVGTETCCGQTYDSLKCECLEGLEGLRWECIIFDEACPSPCPEETTTTTTTSTAAASNDAKWFPDTVDDKPTCRYGSDYPPTYEDYGWLFDDDVDDSGEVIKTGEQKCCVEYGLSCQYQSKFNDDMWYPDTVNGVKTCEYGNEYPSTYALSNGRLFDSEIDCCLEFKLSHCIPKVSKWFPKLGDDGSKGCVNEVPPSEMPSTFLFSKRDDCCVAYPEACPTTTLPTTTTPRPSIETPDCEESAEGNECAWWPELVSTEEGFVLHCQYSSSWPEVAADHLSQDDDGNGYYTCCDKYSCTKNADGSYVMVMEERSNTATNAPTPLPSNGPTSEPTRLPSRSPSKGPTRNPTTLPTHLPSGSPTRNPTQFPTHLPSSSPTKNPSNRPTHLPSDSPTKNPSNRPTHLPSDSPTRNPTNLPTHLPSSSPTKRPSDKPVEDVICGKVWDPVCGEDGVSYSNDCEAIKADVKVVSVGECEPPAESCSPGEKCSVEGSSCSVGTETCCGQTYDSLKCGCSKGVWLCLVTEACMLPCSPTFAPTTATRQPTPLPSKEPTNTPTMRPVDATTTTTTVAATTTTSGVIVTRSSGLCGEWHVSRVNMKTCTNSRVGMKEPGPDCAEWYASGEECCISYLGEAKKADCQIIDVSVDTTSTTTSTEATLPLSPCDEWHPNPNDSTKCTNSDVYPSVWREYFYDSFFFRTAEACCEQREQQGSRCSVVDVCTFCTEEYSPVCGSDGSTYGNRCKAEAAGINRYVTGTCDEVVAATTTTTTSTTTTPATTTTTTPETTTTTPATTTTTTTPATTTTTTPATTTTTTTPATTTPATTTTTTTPATTTTTTTPATTTTTTTPATTTTTSATTTSNPGDMEENSGTLGTTTTTTPATTTTTTTPATTTTTTTTTPVTTTTSTTTATTTSNPGDMEENSGTLGTTTTTTPATTTTTTTPATTTTTTTTTPVTTTTSTTTATTTSNPGDMEENSGTLGTTTTTAPTDTTCSVYDTRRQCQRHKKDGCDWDKTTRVCRHEDEEEMEPNSDSAADDAVCASLSKRRSKCEKQGCVWSRSKTNKENRCQSSSGQSSSSNLASKSSKGSKSK